MTEIVVKKVCGRRDLRRFIAFPNKLFKDVPSFIPALNFDEVNLLSDKNPSLEHCTRELYLAYRGNEVVGRVAAIINRSINEHWNKKAVRFGWFDFIEDYSVFSALLEKVVDYGRANGMEEVEGPFGFTDMDKECWAIDHFDARQNISTLYNPEYYIKFIERAGYEIKCKWQQYSMQANQPVPEKVGRLNKLIMEKYHLKLVKVKRRKDLIPYAWQFFHAINDSFKDLYDFVPMTEKEIKVYIDEYFPFVNLDFVQFVVDENDKLVAFGLSIPDLNAAYKKANGNLFPFGWYHILRAFRKFDTIDLLLNGVLPEWQKRGVHSIYYSDMNEAAIEHGVHTAYTNPQIIGNEAVKIWETQYHTTPLMQRAVFGKAIGG